ncbi:hypothetical protein SNEBB_000413 [Seison nebaliae]|nr:hypothetical protein SNEBB_000413 [Seison nebaliae]
MSEGKQALVANDHERMKQMHEAAQPNCYMTVDELPGIFIRTAQTLRLLNCNRFSSLSNMFISMNRDQQRFALWLQSLEVPMSNIILLIAETERYLFRREMNQKCQPINYYKKAYVCTEQLVGVIDHEIPVDMYPGMTKRAKRILKANDVVSTKDFLILYKHLGTHSFLEWLKMKLVFNDRRLSQWLNSIFIWNLKRVSS